MKTFTMAAYVILSKPTHHIHVQFKVHEFPRKIAIQLIVFLWKNISNHASFSNLAYQFPIIKTSIQTDAATIHVLNQLVHSTTLLLTANIKCLHNLSNQQCSSYARHSFCWSHNSAFCLFPNQYHPRKAFHHYSFPSQKPASTRTPLQAYHTPLR